MAMNSHFRAAQEKLKGLFESHTADNVIDPAAPAQPLHVDSVQISGPGTHEENGITFVGRLGGSQQENGTERFDLVVNFPIYSLNTGVAETDLRALNQDHVRKGLLEGIRTAFSGIALTTPGQHGATLDGYYNFEGKMPEGDKPQKEQLADLHALVTAGIEEAKTNGKPLAPQLAEFLTHAQMYDAKESSVFGSSSSDPRVTGEYVDVTLSVKSGAEVEGGKSNLAVVTENIEARKAEILKAIADQAVGMRTASGASPEEIQRLQTDLSKLDLQITPFNNESWHELTVHFGNKIEASAGEHQDPNAVKVGETLLKEFEPKSLAKILNDNLLFHGTGAEQVAPLIAAPSDLRRVMEENIAAAPESFGKALDTPILRNALSWQEQEKLEQQDVVTKKIDPVVKILSGVDASGKFENKAHILLGLPKGVKLIDVVRELGRQEIAIVGEKTGALAAEQAAPPTQEKGGSGKAA